METCLADVSMSSLVIMGEQDPDFADLHDEAAWIAQALHPEVVMVTNRSFATLFRFSGLITHSVSRVIH